MIVERQADGTVKVDGVTTDVTVIQVLGHDVQTVMTSEGLVPVETPGELEQEEDWRAALILACHNPGLFPGQG